MLDAPISLGSLSNFRDLGGLPLSNGGRTRTGWLYRSSRLIGLSAADIQSLETRDVAAIVDFRGVNEAELAPLALSPRLMQQRVAFAIEPQAGARIRMAEAEGSISHEIAHAIMVDSYRAYVTDHAHTYAHFIRFVAAAQGPVIFHCSAGKDRTGFGAALLLAALGVMKEAILADYMRTNTDWQPPADIGDRVPETYRRALLGVDPDYLAAAFDILDREHGGAENFTRAALGSKIAFDGFRRKLTAD
ncbi:MAG TPA: tyrosine-protein phosphatase [Ramlibacter sp.]|jgi:protein-tyrosine phosphatase